MRIFLELKQKQNKMTQEQYNKYMDGLVLKVASKKTLNKKASITKKAGKGKYLAATALGGGVAGIWGIGKVLSSLLNKKEPVQNAVPEKGIWDKVKETTKKVVDPAKDITKKTISVVKEHPYIAGGAATAALAGGLLGAYLIRKNQKDNKSVAEFVEETKTAAFKKQAAMADKVKEVSDLLVNYGKKGKDLVLDYSQKGLDYAKANPWKTGIAGAGAVGVPAALLSVYYARKNDKSKK